MSVSSISHALARLRDVYDDPLFVRRSHGLEPTPRALELEPQIIRIIEALGNSLEGHVAFDPSKNRRRFKIVCAEPIDSVIGPALVDALRREAPLVTFSTRWAVLDQALRAVLRGEVDVAIGVFLRVSAPLLCTNLFEDDYCVIARAHHPLVQGSRVDWETYAMAGHVFVGNPDEALTHEAPIDRASLHATYGRLPEPDLVRTHAYVSHWETAMLIVAGSDVMADCPRSLAIRHADRLGLQVLDGPHPPFRFKIDAVRRNNASDVGLE